MLGHLGINVDDIALAKSYYQSVLPPLGFDVFLDTDDTIAYRPANGKPGTFLFFYQATDTTGVYSPDQTGLQHLAFIVPTRRAVREARDRAVALGSEIVHQPQEFPQYPPPYFACFWHDPFGFLFEAVCHHDRD